MTAYCIIGNSGRVIEEIESDKSLADLYYEYTDGTRVLGILPKDKMPPDTPVQPLRASSEPSGCMGYEEGPPMDKILAESPTELLSDKGREE